MLDAIADVIDAEREIAGTAEGAAAVLAFMGLPRGGAKPGRHRREAVNAHVLTVL